MRRLLYVAALILAPAARAAIIEGTVSKNDHSCSVDGECYFTITALGKKESWIIYGQEQAPAGGCGFGKSLTDAAWKLTEGQKVRVSVPDRFKQMRKDGSSYYYLCDQGSSIDILP